MAWNDYVSKVMSPSSNWWDKKLSDKQRFQLQAPQDPSLLDIAAAVPNPVGDVASGMLAAQDVSKGNYGMATLNALGLLPFIPSMGATIKNVGKSAKTEFESAHELAQQRAALPVSEGGLGLPATNTAMDRANAMGFDINNPAYHGTRRQFNEFEVLQPTGAIGNKPGVYFAKDKSHAEDFALNGDYLDEKSRIIKALLKDAEMKKSYAGTEYIVDNPANIRDVNAAFDPFRRNEADILAGVGVGIPVSSGLLNVEEKKESKKAKKKIK